MRSRDSTWVAESDAAASEATKGALRGAAKWGIIAGFLGVTGHALSPIYKGLTIQFKLYIQISGMMLGAMLEADSRLRAYEFRMRREKKRLADEAVWRRWEGLVEEEMERQKSRGEEERRPG